jgi:molybdate transport system substrate-binding protein
MNSRLLMLVAVLLIVNLASAQETRTLSVFAAASLTDAFGEIETAFEAANSGVDVIYSFESSATLATQITQGAPADVFASANTRQMQAVADAGLLAGQTQAFVRNRLVVAIPASNPANLQTLADLANEGVQIVIAGEGVPVRDYTNTMLERMAADPVYGEDYRTAFLANVVSEEANVRQVAAKIALGEADAGIVYLSDITPELEVITLPIPDRFNTLAAYPISALNTSTQPELAQAFIDYVLSDAGQETLVRWGFITVRVTQPPATITLPTDGTLTISGQVLNPLTLTADVLRAAYTPYTLDATYLSGEETITATFTGALLWDVLSDVQIDANANVRNDILSLFIVATGADGYQAVLSWGEIAPEYGGEQVLIAYEQDGAPLPETDGALRLVVPGDVRGGRYVSQLINLSIYDAPVVGGE